MKWSLLVLLTAVVYNIVCTTVAADESEDEFDGVMVEEEPIVTSEENVYESPTPTDQQSVYLWEHFDDAAKSDQRWLRSAAKKEGTSEDIAKYDGQWSMEKPMRDSLSGDLALVLKSKAKHAAIATRMTRPFHFKGERPLVVQYEVNFQDGQECGGAYLKLLSDGPDTTDLSRLRDSTPYSIMFGPDKCGNDHKLHFIFRHVNPLNGSVSEKHLSRKPDERIEEYFRDKRPHLYTLVVRPEGTYEVRVDSKLLVRGSLLDDFEPPVNPPEEIDDPADTRPTDWDDREKIPDPGAVKPDDWDEDAPAHVVDTLAAKPAGWLDDEPPMVPDPSAVRPDDWDEEMDGAWEAPLVDNPRCADGVPGCGQWQPPTVPNPAYRGRWRAPLIDNPNYRGVWRSRRIPNPHHFRDERPFASLQPAAAVGFELWSMSRDVLFDNVLVTDSEQTAEELARRTWRLKRDLAERDAVSWWGRAMRATNRRPGWWAVYAVWCVAPLALYAVHLRRRVAEESLLTRLLVYADEQPWLWAVYILALGVPVALALYCCCIRQSAHEQPPPPSPQHDTKKTDEPTEDDDASELPPDDEQPEDDEPPADAGDAPRKRRVRKE